METLLLLVAGYLIYKAVQPSIPTLSNPSPFSVQPTAGPAVPALTQSSSTGSGAVQAPTTGNNSTAPLATAANVAPISPAPPPVAVQTTPYVSASGMTPAIAAAIAAMSADGKAILNAYLPGYFAAGESESVILHQIAAISASAYPDSNFAEVYAANTPIAEALLADGTRVPIYPGESPPSGYATLYPTQPGSLAESAAAMATNGQLTPEQKSYYQSIGLNV